MENNSENQYFLPCISDVIAYVLDTTPKYSSDDIARALCIQNHKYNFGCMPFPHILCHAILSLSEPLCEDFSLVRTLCLRGCKLGDEVAGDIAKLFPQFVALQSLNLEQNRISDSGIALIASALVQCPSLHFLNVSYNSFSSQSIFCIAKLVQLQELIIINNISGSEAHYLSEQNCRNVL